MDKETAHIISNLFKRAKRYKSADDMTRINILLCEVAKHLRLSIADKKRCIKTLVKKYGANDFNYAALMAIEYEIVKYLCDLGADNFNDIYNRLSSRYSDNKIKVIVYLINRGETCYKRAHPLNKELYLQGGAGKIINDDPSWLSHLVAIPYIAQRSSIITTINKYLINDITNIIAKYLIYEKPKISEKEIAALNRQFNIYHSIAW